MLDPQKKGPGYVGAPFSCLLCRVKSSGYFYVFHRDSHRVRGVLSFVALLSPVESSSPSGALRAHSILLRPRLARCKRFFILVRG